MAKPPPMGHNGGFFFESRDDLPPDLPKMHFFKLFIQDFLDDLLRLPMDERGFYSTAILTMYKEMQGLPADDKQASMSMMIDVRQYRRLKEKVLERKLLHVTSTGRLSNKRFEAEICAYVTEFKNRREAALDREQRRRVARTSREDRREVSEKSRTSPGEVREISATTTPEIGDNSSKFANEINAGHGTTKPQDEHEVGIRARVLESELELEKKTSIHTNNSCEREREPDEIDPGERSLDPKVVLALRCLREIMPDKDLATQIIETRLDAFAPEDWRDGIEDLARNRRNGREKRLTEEIVVAYVRQAELNRERGMRQNTVDKPPPKMLEPGRIAEGIDVAADRSIVLSNGKRQEWLASFDGNEQLLDLTLKSAAGKLKPYSPTPLEAQITSILADACSNIILRKQNTIVAVDRQVERRGARPSPLASNVEESETELQRTKRMLEQVTNGKAGGNGIA